MEKKSTYRLFWIALIASWLTFFLFVMPALAVSCWLIALVILFVRKSKLGWYFLTFSPWTFVPVFSFLIGTAGYLTGTARMKSAGYPAPSFFNLDREYRVWRSTSGCTVYGTEPFSDWPNNAAIKLWTNLFGYQRGVYAGTYPDHSEAYRILAASGGEVDLIKSAPVASGTAGTNFTFSINGETIALVDLENWSPRALDNCTRLRAAVFNDELIIIGPTTAGPYDMLCLADKNTGEIFARFGF